MKPFKEVINYPVDKSFLIKFDDLPHFRFPLHFHEEFEIIYMIKSFGKKIVGDAVEDFGPGDLSFYGRNLPHFYMSDPIFYTGDPNLRVNAIVIQFPLSYFPESQLQRSEFASVKKLLQSASSGLFFSGESAEIGGEIIRQIFNTNGMERHLLFVKLIDFLGNSKSRTIASADYTNDMKDHRKPEWQKYINSPQGITTGK